LDKSKINKQDFSLARKVHENVAKKSAIGKYLLTPGSDDTADLERNVNILQNNE